MADAVVVAEGLGSTLLKPDRGRARMAGHDVARQPQAVRRLIRLSGQYGAVGPYLTGAEYLVMIGRLYGLSRRAACRIEVAAWLAGLLAAALPVTIARYRHATSS